MARGTVALLGNLQIDRNVLDRVASEFDWSVEQASTLHALREMSAAREVVAVVFNAGNLGASWNQALESVLRAAPRALPVVCAGFSEQIRWDELADAGAFHVLRRPIDESEARHSLGFIWAAKRGDEIPPKAAPQKADHADSREPAPNRFAAKH